MMHGGQESRAGKAGGSSNFARIECAATSYPIRPIDRRFHLASFRSGRLLTERRHARHTSAYHTTQIGTEFGSEQVE